MRLLASRKAVARAKATVSGSQQRGQLNVVQPRQAGQAQTVAGAQPRHNALAPRQDVLAPRQSLQQAGAQPHFNALAPRQNVLATPQQNASGIWQSLQQPRYDAPAPQQSPSVPRRVPASQRIGTKSTLQPVSVSSSQQTAVTAVSQPTKRALSDVSYLSLSLSLSDVCYIPLSLMFVISLGLFHRLLLMHKTLIYRRS